MNKLININVDERLLPEILFRMALYKSDDEKKKLKLITKEQSAEVNSDELMEEAGFTKVPIEDIPNLKERQKPYIKTLDDGSKVVPAGVYTVAEIMALDLTQEDDE